VTDSICASDACVGGMCASSKLGHNESCAIGNDCALGVCGYDAFSVDASPICCPSGSSTRVYTSASDGWPSSGSRYFCTDQPNDTPCGVTDSICASDACVGGMCASSKLGHNESCAIGNDCTLGTCAYGAFISESALVCCPSGSSTRVWTHTSQGWLSNEHRYFCTDQPDDTPCGVTGEICASDSCIEGRCANTNSDSMLVSGDLNPIARLRSRTSSFNAMTFNLGKEDGEK